MYVYLFTNLQLVLSVNLFLSHTHLFLRTDY